MLLTFYIILIVISVTSGSISIPSFITAIGAPIRLITLFITIFLTFSNGFVKLLSIKLKSKLSKHKKTEILAKRSFISVESIILKAIQEFYISENN